MFIDGSFESLVQQPLVYNVNQFDFMNYSRPYDGKWSKTMAGFGPEDDHFVVELTYNYGIKTYQLGNDFQVIIYHQGYGTLMAIFPLPTKIQFLFWG